MERSNLLLVLSTALLASVLLVVGMAHEAYLQACVCVVNSLARGSIFLAASMVTGLVGMVGGPKLGRVDAWAWYVQVGTFGVALFFLVQHVFFTLELA